MRKINVLFAAAMVSLSVWVAACSSDVEPLDPAINLNNGGAVTLETVKGTYRMTEYKTSISTDLNNDGTFSANQMNETSCFNNNLLTLNADMTFTATAKGVRVSNNAIACFTNTPLAGTWTLNGASVVLNYLSNGEENVKTLIVYGSTIKEMIRGGQIVSKLNSNPVYVNANIEVVYTKQP